MYLRHNCVLMYDGLAYPVVCERSSFAFCRRISMQIQRTDIILTAHHYDECAVFYRDFSELPILQENSE